MQPLIEHLLPKCEDQGLISSPTKRKRRQEFRLKLLIRDDGKKPMKSAKISLGDWKNIYIELQSLLLHN